MRASKYGKQVIFLWEGLKKLDKVLLRQVESTLKIPDELQKEADELLKSSKKYDGKLWRYESAFEGDDNLIIDVSPTNYSVHDRLRHEQNKPMEFYPNPIGVNSLQETEDSYILLGRKGSDADYSGLVLLGSGYVESDKHKNLKNAVEDECKEETTYHGYEFSADKGSAMGIIFGSNHDTGVTIYVPLPITHKEVSLGNEEHQDLILLRNDEQTIREVLRAGQYRGIDATDQLLGSLEAYVAKLSMALR